MGSRRPSFLQLISARIFKKSEFSEFAIILGLLIDYWRGSVCLGRQYPDQKCVGAAGEDHDHGYS